MKDAPPDMTPARPLTDYDKVVIEKLKVIAERDALKVKLERVREAARNVVDEYQIASHSVAPCDICYEDGCSPQGVACECICHKEQDMRDRRLADEIEKLSIALASLEVPGKSKAKPADGEECQTCGGTGIIKPDNMEIGCSNPYDCPDCTLKPTDDVSDYMAEPAHREGGE